MRQSRAFLLALCVAAAAWGCSRNLPSSPEALSPGASRIAEAARESADGPQHLEGSIGSGAQYGIDVPAEWNGDLIVYLHGIKPAPAPVELPGAFEDFSTILGMLLAEGYAVAYSSYSENGYAVPEAVRQTHQLSGLFLGKVGKPERTFLLGQSLGGIAGLLLAEKFPQQYDGALLVSGVVGGSKAEVDYLAHVRVVFDYFYPGVLGGDIFHVPDQPFDPAHVLNAILADGGTGAGAMARLKQIQLQYSNPSELVESLITALGVQWVGGEDFFDRTHRHSLFDNEGTLYDALAPGLLPQPLLDDLNARVARWSSTPDAENWLQQYYEPTGDLEIPVLTLHNEWDPVVPSFHETLYRDKVIAAGSSEWLVQRSKLLYGHRRFTPSEIVEAFNDLVEWADSGIKPPA